jgi:AraC family transcriptional regulator
MVRLACVTGRAWGCLGFVVRVAYRYIRPLTVVYARSMGPYQVASAEAWRQMSAWLDRSQRRRRVKQGYGFFRDNPKLTAPELLRYDACVPVAVGLDADPEAGIGRQTLPGGAYAVQTHVGSYADAGELFSRLHREIVPKRGLSVDYDRPFVAIYLNDPVITREVHRRTELCVPVLPVRMPFSSNDDEDEHADAQAVGQYGSGRVPA